MHASIWCDGRMGASCCFDPRGRHCPTFPLSNKARRHGLPSSSFRPGFAPIRVPKWTYASRTSFFVLSPMHSVAFARVPWFFEAGCPFLALLPVLPVPDVSWIPPDVLLGERRLENAWEEDRRGGRKGHRKGVGCIPRGRGREHTHRRRRPPTPVSDETKRTIPSR